MTRAGLAFAAAAMALFASAASAATYYDFQKGGPRSFADSFTFGPMTVTALASQDDAPLVAQVSQAFDGLGVSTAGDSHPHLLDGVPAGAFEALNISFAYAVTLNNLTFSKFDLGDEYAVSINGAAPVTYDLAFLDLGIRGVTSLVISVFGTRGETGILADEFGLRAIEIAPVPVPAAGAVMLFGLGGLAALRRRR